ncbi:CBL-interacting protein kinase 1-like isoform X2 [Lolium rigidum]|uniref:CBL-interacting protein kinase 1-like isoform X2 n=1 Tax=Lolium rigidum TaxID=89674 RepID=UPI001F5D0F4F|nr:CBL-interacting protein kinase 1-like isoform X2 [Lolium rigidum]
MLLPFDDRNLVLYQKIFKGDMHIPIWFSSAAQDLLDKILEPSPMKRTQVGVPQPAEAIAAKAPSLFPIGPRLTHCSCSSGEIVPAMASVNPTIK